MKKGFTIVEVSILFVIFLIVAFLVAPLSLDDTKQAQNISRWRSVQQDFVNIFFTIENYQEENKTAFKDAFESIMNNEIKKSIPPYRITYKNGSLPDSIYKFKDFNLTYSNAVFSYIFFEEPKDDRIGVLMYDVNGKNSPNIWGKDVFAFELYNNKFEPFGKSYPVNKQKQDCLKHGTGMSCSNYYLIGGNFD